MPEASDTKPNAPPRRALIRRHSLPVRIGHWVNLACMTILLMSGLQIFNAHPALYWGDKSVFAAPIASIGAEPGGAGGPRGILTIFGRRFDTTGVLGVSPSGAGRPSVRGFPAWATIPSNQWLSMGRRWHFFFAWIFVANGAAYALYGMLSGHFWRDLLPSRHEVGRIGRSIWDHLRLRFPRGKEARRYNVLQKLSYLVVVFGLVPLLILAGLAMSPRLDAAVPWLPAILGGRQAARTIHFACAFALLLFTAVHVLMVVVSGVWNNMRSMVTGRYAIDAAAGDDER